MTENSSTSTGVDGQGAMRQTQNCAVLAYQDRPPAPCVPAPGIRNPESGPERNCEPMAGVESQGQRSKVTERATVNRRVADLSLATDSAELCVESTHAFKRDNLACRIADWPKRLLAIARTASRRNHAKRPGHYYPPLRENFIEDAAMHREMFRL